MTTQVDWATDYFRSEEEVAALQGQPFDRNRAWAAIRDAFTNPRRRNDPDDSGFEHDDGMTEAEALAGADVLEARETAAREWRAS